MPRLKPDELLGANPGEPSAKIRARVIAARNIQTMRLGPGRTNSKMTPKEIKNLIPIDEDAQNFMRIASQRMGLSARVFDRLLKVARTIADLATEQEVKKVHLAEAVQYRERLDT